MVLLLTCVADFIKLGEEFKFDIKINILLQAGLFLARAAD